MKRTAGEPRRRLAQGLAAAFLAGDWDPPAMARRGGRALGVRRRWLDDLARAVRTAYPERPDDRPAELARFVGACPPFDEGVRQSTQRGELLVSVRRWYAPPTAMGPTPWPVPPLPSLGDLATFLDLDAGLLAWFADRRGLERTVADEPLRHYRYRWLAGSGGSARLLERPKERLKALQRRLLAEVLDPIPAHDAAHGFVAGRSVATFATPHAGRAVVVRVDLESFFASVAAGRVYGLLRTAGYPEPVAHALTALVTNVVPRAVWRSAPPPPTARAGAHHRLGRRLATPHLPQGAPTSPALANLAAFGLDRRLTGLAASLGVAYSRYADDLAFSGGPELHRLAPTLLRAVADIAGDEGFKVHEGKTRLAGRARRQVLAGLVVNERPQCPRAEYERLKATLHNAARSGPAGQARGHPRFREHLLGRIAWVGSTNAARGERLRASFDRIDWTA